MQTIEEIISIARRKNSFSLPRSIKPPEPIDLFAEPKGIQIRIIQDPNTGRKVFAQAFSNGEGRPPYLQIQYSSNGDHTPLPPNYFDKTIIE